MSHDCKSELGFLARDPIYNTVKPYSLRFDPPDSSPRNNLTVEKTEVIIHDARTLDPTIEENGFTLVSIPTEMTCKDFDQRAMIERVYAKELEACLKGLFDARHVRVIDYAVGILLPFPGIVVDRVADNRSGGVTLTFLSPQERITKTSNQLQWYISVWLCQCNPFGKVVEYI
jgi:hypothetical protein